jgi:hypothetical protein
VKRLGALLLLLGLLLVADRAGAAFAARAIAEQTQAEAGLAAPPDVSISGFPFLTQAVGGRYEQVTVRATDVEAGEVRVSGFEATLTGVQVPLRDALSGSVTSVPVSSVRARALVTYDELTQRSGDRQLTVAPVGPGQVRVKGSVRVLGQTFSAAAVSRVEVVGGDLLVTAESYEVGNKKADRLVTRALGGRLDLRVPVQGLPYGLEVTGIEVEDAGLAVVATVGRTVLGRVAAADALPRS